MSSEPSNKLLAKGTTPRPVLVLFGVGFFLMGTVFSTHFIGPVRAALAADDWRETRCRVLRCEFVRANPEAFRVVIEYEYSFGGVTHRSDRYSFTSLLSNNPRWLKEMTERMAPGTETTCFVNPDDPDEAVIIRSLTPDMAVGLAPVMFMAIGVLVAFQGLRREPIATEDWDLADDTELKSPDGSLIEILLILCFAVAFNAMVISLLAHFWNDIAGGMSLFVVPFGLAGIGLAGYSGVLILRRFNPVPQLRLDSSHIRAGESFRLRWRLVGNTGRMNAVRISLEGARRVADNEADGYRDTVIAQFPILGKDSGLCRPHGEVTFVVPADARPTGNSPLGEVFWRFTVLVEIPWWPNVCASFPVDLLPMADAKDAHVESAS